jgi:hypothetical protein
MRKETLQMMKEETFFHVFWNLLVSLSLIIRRGIIAFKEVSVTGHISLNPLATRLTVNERVTL